MRNLAVQFITVCLSLLIIQGCKDNRDKFSETYVTALSRGDLVEVNIDTAALTLNYKVLDGDLKGQTGRDTLKPYPDVTRYAYKALSLQGTVIAIQGEVIIGHIQNDFYVGVPEKKEPLKIADIIGLYNYVSFSPGGTVDEATGIVIPWQKSSYGTLLLKDDNTWSVLHKDNLKTSTKKPTLSGQFSDMGNGILLLEQNGNKFAHMMIRRNAGDHSAVIDLVDPKFKGIAFANLHSPVAADEIAGPYTALLTTDDKAYKCLADNGRVSIVNEGTTYSLKVNDPWPGLVRGEAPLPNNERYEFVGIVSKPSGSIYGIHLKRQEHGAAVHEQGFITLKEPSP